MIGHHYLLRDVMGQSYTICTYACAHANHVRYSSVGLGWGRGEVGVSSDRCIKGANLPLTVIHLEIGSCESRDSHS